MPCNAIKPRQISWQKDLYKAHYKFASFRAELNDTDAALVNFERANALAIVISSRLSKDIKWQKELFLSYHRLGWAQDATDNRKQAYISYNNAFNIAQALAKADPQNIDWQKSLIFALRGMAVTTPGDAADHYSDALVIAEMLDDTGKLTAGNRWILDDLKKEIGGDGAE